MGSQTPTPSQTIGPFFHVAMSAAAPARLAVEGAATVELRGRVLDGAGEPVDDALVEVWDADRGRFARCHTGQDGSFAFLVDAGAGTDAGSGDRSATGRYLAVGVFARGLLHHLVTRCYLGVISESEAHADPALAAVPPDRRSTLVAEREAAGGGTAYRFDIHLQGDRETVFFAF